MDPARNTRAYVRRIFKNVLGRWERSELSQAEAAELFGAGEPTCRR